MERKKVRLLWTGGWDSTFRMVQLSHMDGVEVQPVYITGKKASVEQEKKAIRKIWRALMERHPKCRFHHVEYVEKGKDFAVPREFDEAYRRLQERFPALGDQYRMLGAYAALHPGVELGEEHYYEKPGTLYSIFNAVGGLRFDGDGIGHLPGTVLDPDIRLLFGNYSFPIARYKELEMKEMVERWHDEDVMAHVWFCQDPIHGKPCGCCVPCQIKMKAHMDFLLPEESKKRYRAFKAIEAQDPEKAEAFRSFLKGEKEKGLAFIAGLSCWWKTEEVQKEKERLEAEIREFQKIMECA